MILKLSILANTIRKICRYIHIVGKQGVVNEAKHGGMIKMSESSKKGSKGEERTRRCSVDRQKERERKGNRETGKRKGTDTQRVKAKQRPQ